MLLWKGAFVVERFHVFYPMESAFCPLRDGIIYHILFVVGEMPDFSFESRRTYLTMGDASSSRA